MLIYHISKCLPIYIGNICSQKLPCCCSAWSVQKFKFLLHLELYETNFLFFSFMAHIALQLHHVMRNNMGQQKKLFVLLENMTHHVWTVFGHRFQNPNLGFIFFEHIKFWSYSERLYWYITVIYMLMQINSGNVLPFVVSKRKIT